MPEAFKVFTKELKGLAMNVLLYNREGNVIDMDALAKQSLIEERKTNSSIRSAMAPKEEEVDVTSTVEVDADAAAEEGLTIAKGVTGDND